LKQNVEELQAQDNSINQYEMQIARNHWDVGKRQNKANHLNR
jgi:hypothetical protein